MSDVMSMALYARAELEHIDNQAFYNNHLGPFLCGLSFQTFMMGVLTLQTWHYFEYFSHDACVYRALATVMFVTGAIQCGTDFALLYDSFIYGFGDIQHWNHFTWLFYYEPGFTALIAAIAQAFFLYRCYKFTRLKWVLVLGILGMLLAFAAGCAVTDALSKTDRFTQTFQAVPLGGIWLGSTAVTDLLISGTLIWSLKSVQTDFKSTKRLVSRIVHLSFETAALTTLVAFGNFVASFYAEQNTAHLLFQFVMGKMYSHSVMVTLLARKRLARTADNTSIKLDHISTNGGTISGATDSAVSGNLNFKHPSNRGTVTVSKSQMSTEESRDLDNRPYNRPRSRYRDLESGYGNPEYHTKPPSPTAEVARHRQSLQW